MRKFIQNAILYAQNANFCRISPVSENFYSISDGQVYILSPIGIINLRRTKLNKNIYHFIYF